VSFVVPNGQCFNNNSFSFSPYGTFTETAEFIWDFGTNSFTTSSNVKEPSGIQFNQIGAQTVSVQVNDAGCISNLFTANVIVYPEPTANFTSLIVEGCQPLKVKFTNQSLSLDPLLYSWSFGNGATSQSVEPEYTYQNSGVFSVGLNVTTSNGCNAQIQYPDLIRVLPKPTAGFKADRYETTIDEPQLFISDLSTQSDTCEYILSNGEVINKCNFSYQFLQVGTYTITQLVENEFGCIDSISKTIIIKPAYRLYIPNSFTPNFDLLNDEFRVYGEEIVEFNMQIFNRFGQKVYESYDINSGWDGTVRLSDKISPSGVYTYLIYARSTDGEEFKYMNTVILVR
jgi:gliding motility-associated-like protein